MTRARERLALVGSVRGLEERAADWLAECGEAGDLADGGSPLAWLGPVLARHPAVARELAGLAGSSEPPEGPAPFPVRVVLYPAASHAAAPPGAERPPAAGAALSDPAPADPAGEVATVRARLDAEAAWRYPHEAAASLPAKASVGELAGRGGAAGDGEEPAVDLAPESPASVRLALPRFAAAGRPPDAAETGAATHVLLRHLDLAGPCDRHAISRCLEDLVDRELLEPRLARAVDALALERALDRPLGRRLRAAAPGGVRREVPFALRLPATEVASAAPRAEWVLVQGVVDALLVAPDGLVLVDYKTDRVAGETDRARVLARHRAQLALYARAVAAAWGRPVREAWLCLLAAGRDEPVPLPDRLPDPQPLGGP
jgi:ATP-dependent helicase/nuclease subunit A